MSSIYLSRFMIQGLAVSILFSAGTLSAQTYYVSASGHDENDGLTQATAWKTIDRVNREKLSGGGKKVLFEGGQTFSGNLLLNWQDWATVINPSTLSSYGEGKATLYSPAGKGIDNVNAGGWAIKNLIIKGSGSPDKSSIGIRFQMSEGNGSKKYHSIIENVDVHGFNTCVLFGAWDSAGSHNGWQDVVIHNNEIHDCFEAGVRLYGRKPDVENDTFSNYNIRVTNNHVYNIVGDPNDDKTHTGHGIWMGQFKGAVVEWNRVHDGGQNNKTCGGPVGIWFDHMSDALVQYNEVYNWKQGTGCDGGGFDFDGGSQNSIFQYNYSHDNEGPGYLLGNFDGAGIPWVNNIVRYNITVNDATKHGAGITLFNNGQSQLFDGVSIYNNTVIMSEQGGSAFSAPDNDSLKNIQVYNNIFYSAGKKKLLQLGVGEGNTINNNLYYRPDNEGVEIRSGDVTYTDFSTWQKKTGYELEGGESSAHVNIDPKFVGSISNPAPVGGILQKKDQLTAFHPSSISPVIGIGWDLRERFGLEIGHYDFTGNQSKYGSAYDLGAIELSLPKLSDFSTSHVNESCSGAADGTITITADEHTGQWQLFSHDHAIQHHSGLAKGFTVDNLAAGTHGFHLYAYTENWRNRRYKYVQFTLSSDKKQCLMFSSNTLDETCTGAEDGQLTIGASSFVGKWQLFSSDYSTKYYQGSEKSFTLNNLASGNHGFHLFAYDDQWKNKKYQHVSANVGAQGVVCRSEESSNNDSLSLGRLFVNSWAFKR